jgi:hypothetical protein
MPRWPSTANTYTSSFHSARQATVLAAALNRALRSFLHLAEGSTSRAACAGAAAARLHACARTLRVRTSH